MEVGVRIIGVILRLIDFLLTPFFWLASMRQPKRHLPPPKELHTWSATRLAHAVRVGEMTSEELVTSFIDRVKEVNKFLNAVVDERYGAALIEAKQVDRMIAQAREAGTLEELVEKKPLLGVPFTVKESCSLGGMSNAVGCLEYAGRRATADGAAVALVRAAGAIPLLVSNTPELCLGWETTNLLSGTTNNPYCLTKTAGGSSGGEAALLACGASAFSVASDIAGSIRLPAAFCGVFGHKPTPGIIPIEGHIPTLNDKNYPKFLTVGPMTRKAEDLPLLLNIMAGENKHKLRLDEPVDLSKLKVLYMTEASDSIALTPVDDSIKKAVENAARYLGECGATISEEKFEELGDSVEISISVFFSMKDIPNMLQDPTDPKRQRSLIVELLKHLVGSASRSLQGLGFALIDKTKLFIPEARRRHYCQRADILREHITESFLKEPAIRVRTRSAGVCLNPKQVGLYLTKNRTLGDNGVFLYPVFPGAAHAHGAVFARAAGVLYSMPLNVLGLPATAVPLAARPLPLAVQVIAGPGQDRLCVAVARRLEAVAGGWRPPLAPRGD